MYKRIITILIGALISYTILADETLFSSELLRQSVEVLHCKSQIDSLPNGSHIITTNEGQRLRVGKRYGRLVHMGIPIFSQTIYEEYPPIFDFIEFAALDHTYHISDNPFLFKSLVFKEGTWNDLLRVDENTPCTINSELGRTFEVIWKYSEGRSLVLMVPVEYNRLALMSRREIEDLFLAEMRCYLAPSKTVINEIEEKNLITQDSIVWVLPGSSYILPQINKNTYYQYEDNAFTLIYDSKYPNETLANIINANSEELPSVTLDILFERRSTNTETYRIGLADFISFCQTKGCTAYWGLEKVDGKIIAGSLYLDNRASAYCHLIRLKANLSHPINSSFKMNARASIYIPTNYIENLFQQYKPNNK